VRFVLSGVNVEAVPHDLFKIIDWRRHSDPKLIERELPDTVKGKYKIPCKGIDGKEDFRPLERVIERHHSVKSFWSRMWSYADSLSTIAARFRLEYDYWYLKGGDPFFFRVYGDIKEWSANERRETLNKVIEVLARYADRAEEHGSAFVLVNELLAEFPADSRFPFTSLKTHHWLTQAIYNNRVFWDKMSKAALSSEDANFDVFYMIRINIAEPEFHRLRELRSFIDLRSKIMKIAKERLDEWFPLQVGDDLYLICLSRAELPEIMDVLAGTGFGFDLYVYEWRIRREERATHPARSTEKIYLVEGVDLNRYSIGVYEEFEYSPEKVAEYAEILEGGYDYVAWVCLKPRGDMEFIARSFLESGERELERRYGVRRVELKEPVRGPAENFLSPELALSIAEGYGNFLADCEKALREAGFEAAIAFKSFNRTVYISGIRELPDAYKIYSILAERKAKLHIPSILIVAETKPKYPFWHILELFDSVNMDSLIFVANGKMSKLTDRHVKLIRRVIPSLRRERKRQFYRIVNSACKDDKEVLKIKIEGLAHEKKLHPDTASKLCWLVDEIARENRNDEDKRKQITCEIFKILRMFTK